MTKRVSKKSAAKVREEVPSTDDDQSSGVPAETPVESSAPQPAAKRGLIRRTAGAVARSGNWFFPVNTTIETAASTKASLGRIGGGFAMLFTTVRRAWVTFRTEPDAEDVVRATTALAVIGDRERATIQSGARRMWAAGGGMCLMGFGLMGYVVLHPIGIVGTLVYVLASLLWVGFGIAYAMRSASDWHALDRRVPVSGMTVLRDPALWLPIRRSGNGK